MNPSSKPGVRNPILLLPAAQEMLLLPPELKALNRALLKEFSQDCRERANEAWRKHKAPMAAYWKGWAVYARHAAMLCR